MFSTWNANHPKAEDVGDWFPQLLQHRGRGVLMIQEPPAGGVEEPSYHFVGRKGGLACVGIPSELEPAISWTSDTDVSFCDFTCAAAVSFQGKLGAVSCYFPCLKHQERFLVAVHECRQLLAKLKAMGCQKFVVGCDLNSQIPSNFSHHTIYCQRHLI